MSKKDLSKDVDKLKNKIKIYKDKIEIFKTQEIKEIARGLSMCFGKEAKTEDIEKNFDLDNLSYVKEMRKQIDKLEQRLASMNVA